MPDLRETSGPVTIEYYTVDCWPCLSKIRIYLIYPLHQCCVTYPHIIVLLYWLDQQP